MDDGSTSGDMRMNRIRFDRRQFLIRGAAAAGALGLAGPVARAASPNVVGIAPSTRPGPSVTQLAVKDPSAIKALQFTDLHFFCKPMLPRLDQLTAEDMARYVDCVEPDLLLISGDTWHDNPDNRGEEFMHYAVDKITRLGIPWAFTWGNHDELDDYAKGHDFLSDAPHSLYCGGPSSGNYRVELVHEGAPVWELICMNSSNRGLMAPQQAWLRDLAAAREGAAKVPAFAVIHIPIKQYDEVWENKQAAGIKLEDVSYWDEDGSSYELLRAACDFRAYFCGHDHVNNFIGKIDGAELVFGQATGHGGYGGNLMPKGAKLITINAEESRYTCESLFPDGSRWRPAPDMRVDDVNDSPWEVPGNRRREQGEVDE